MAWLDWVYGQVFKGAASFKGDFDAAKAHVGSTFTCSGAATLHSTLATMGKHTATEVTVGSTFVVSGGALLQSTATIVGPLTGGSAWRGTVDIASGDATGVVSITGINSNSIIILTKMGAADAASGINLRDFEVVSRTTGTSFTVSTTDGKGTVRNHTLAWVMFK